MTVNNTNTKVLVVRVGGKCDRYFSFVSDIVEDHFSYSISRLVSSQLVW